MKVLKWINSNPDFLCLLAVIFVSGMPFWGNHHSAAYYTFFGGFFAFMSTLFLKLDVKIGRNVTRLYSITLGVISIIGFFAFMFLSMRPDNRIASPIESFGLTYMGAIGGILFGGLIFLNDKPTKG